MADMGALESRVEDDFGRYAGVRRVAVGLVRAFDSGLVPLETFVASDSTMMVDTPRYWLASAVVGLGAWSEGDRVLCQDAVRTAYNLAPSRTALMFALILRRQGRLAAAVVWLRHYLRNQDPMALSREFAVVLEAVGQGAFGAGGRRAVHETVDGWLAVLADDEEMQTAQVERWLREIERHQPDGGVDESLSWLGEYCPQWPQMADVLLGIETQRGFFERYLALVSAEHRTSDRVEDSVDDILDVLVAEYDPEEMPLRRELAFQRAVIEFEGDRDRARVVADAASPDAGDTLDYLTVQTAAALRPDSIGASPGTQQVALASCVGWAQRAHTEFCASFRSQVPATVEVVFPERQPVGDSDFVVPSWRGDLGGTAMTRLERSLSAHWDAAAGSLDAADRAGFRRALIWPAMVSAAVLAAGLVVNPMVGAVVAVTLFGLALLVVGWRRRSVTALTRRHRRSVGGGKAAALADLRAVGDEYRAFQERLREADSDENRVRALIESFAELGAGAERPGV